MTNIVPSTLTDFDMSKFNTLEDIYDNFRPSYDEMEKAFGNTGILVDEKFKGSSQKSRDLLIVIIVFDIIKKLLIKPLSEETYTEIYKKISSGYSEDNPQFINWVMNITDIKPKYQYQSNNVRRMLEWNLERTRDNLVLDNQTDFNDIVYPSNITDQTNIADQPDNGVRVNNLIPDDDDLSGGYKRKQKSKKSRRSQKKRKITRKTNKRRTTKKK